MSVHIRDLAVVVVALLMLVSPFVVLIAMLGWKGVLAIACIALFAVPMGVASR